MAGIKTYNQKDLTFFDPSHDRSGSTKPEQPMYPEFEDLPKKVLRSINAYFRHEIDELTVENELGI